MEDLDLVAFDMYFASVVSMQYHPGSGTKEHKRLSLEECREIALKMIELRKEVKECH